MKDIFKAVKNMSYHCYTRIPFLVTVHSLIRKMLVRNECNKLSFSNYVDNEYSDHKIVLSKLESLESTILWSIFNNFGYLAFMIFTLFELTTA